MTDDTIYCIINRKVKLKDIGAAYLNRYLKEGYTSKLTYEKAEEARLNREAYDTPSDGRVIGFKITPFIPNVKKETRKQTSK